MVTHELPILTQKQRTTSKLETSLSNTSSSCEDFLKQCMKDVCPTVKLGSWRNLAYHHGLPIAEFWTLYKKFRTPLAFKVDQYLGRHRPAQTYRFATENGFWHRSKGTLPYISHSIQGGGGVYQIPTEKTYDKGKYLTEPVGWMLAWAADLLNLGSMRFTLSEFMRPKYKRFVIDIDGEFTFIEILAMLRVLYDKVIIPCFPDCKFLKGAILERRGLSQENLQTRLQKIHAQKALALKKSKTKNNKKDTLSDLSSSSSNNNYNTKKEFSKKKNKSEYNDQLRQEIKLEGPELDIDCTGGIHIRFPPEIAIDEIAHAELKYAIKHVIQEHFEHYPEKCVDLGIDALRCSGAYRTRDCRTCILRKKAEEKRHAQALMDSASASEKDPEVEEIEKPKLDDLGTDVKKRQSGRKKRGGGIGKTGTSATSGNIPKCNTCGGAGFVIEDLPYLPDIVLTDKGNIDIQATIELWEIFCDRKNNNRLVKEPNSTEELKAFRQTDHRFAYVYSLIPRLSLRYVSSEVNRYYRSFWEQLAAPAQPDALVQYLRSYNESLTAVDLEENLKNSKSSKHIPSIFSPGCNLAIATHNASGRNSEVAKVELGKLNKNILDGLKQSAAYATSTTTTSTTSRKSWPQESKLLKHKNINNSSSEKQKKIISKPETHPPSPPISEPVPVPDNVWESVTNMSASATTKNGRGQPKTIEGVLRKRKITGEQNVPPGSPAYAQIQHLFNTEPFFQTSRYRTYFGKLCIRAVTRSPTQIEKKQLNIRRGETRAKPEIQQEILDRKQTQSAVIDTLGVSNITRIKKSIKIDDKLKRKGKQAVDSIHEQWSNPFRKPEYENVREPQKLSPWAIFPRYFVSVNSKYCISKQGEHKRTIWFELKFNFVGINEVPVFGIYQRCPCQCIDKTWKCNGRFNESPVCVLDSSSAQELWPEYTTTYIQARIRHQERQDQKRNIKTADRAEWVRNISPRPHLLNRPSEDGHLSHVTTKTPMSSIEHTFFKKLRTHGSDQETTINKDSKTKVVRIKKPPMPAGLSAFTQMLMTKNNPKLSSDKQKETLIMKQPTNKNTTPTTSSSSYSSTSSLNVIDDIKVPHSLSKGLRKIRSQVPLFVQMIMQKPPPKTKTKKRKKKETEKIQSADEKEEQEELLQTSKAA